MSHNKKEIPTTELRAIYNLLRMLSTNTRRQISDDFNRKENYIKLADIYNRSKKHFEKYENINEPFLSAAPRKPLCKSGSTITKTNDVTSAFEENSENIIVVDGLGYDFRYIDREVSPIRTTNAEFDTGMSGQSSGTGGLDFIGWNLKDQIPVLGEIKVKNDEDPFFALIQLLTYCSELSTGNQIKRINETQLFGTRTTIYKPFYLYVILVDYNSTKNPDLSVLFENAKNIGTKIKTYLDEDLKEVVFLNMDRKSNVLNIL